MEVQYYFHTEVDYFRIIACSEMVHSYDLVPQEFIDYDFELINESIQYSCNYSSLHLLLWKKFVTSIRAAFLCGIETYWFFFVCLFFIHFNLKY